MLRIGYSVSWILPSAPLRLHVLTPGKWVKVDDWANAAEADRLVGEAIARYNHGH